METKERSSNSDQNYNQQLYNYFFSAALLKGPSFYKYDNYDIPIKYIRLQQSKQNQQNYEIIKKIGRGKYSDVFKCVNVNNEKEYVLKILKPVRQQKIKRQLKILSQLNHPNIIKLEEIILDETSKCNCLVMEYVEAAQYRDLIEILESQQIKKIMFQLLQGLKYCHERGIMHRDIKPHNILIDKKNLSVKISDWGLAEYYLPNTEYNVRVASRHFKGPELLLNNRFYDFSLDIWSLGLVFAGFLFRTYTLFQGDDNPDQLNQIMKHFGSKQIQQYISMYKLQPDEQTQKYIDSCKQKNRRPWSYYIKQDVNALDLLDKMLQIDHKKRINVIQALQHSYFANLYQKN